MPSLSHARVNLPAVKNSFLVIQLVSPCLARVAPVKGRMGHAQSCASALHGDSEGAKKQISSPNCGGPSKHKVANAG